MLTFKELPYLFTILFAVLGYTVKEFSSEILATTFIEYEYASGQDSHGRFVSYYITNTSKKDSYKDLAFTIRAGGDITFKKGVRVSKRPTFHQFGSVLDVEDHQQFGVDYANFEINHLIPGSTYELRVYYEGKLPKTPDLLFHVDRMIEKKENYDFSKPPVYLREAGLATYSAKNKIEIYLFLIIIWTLLIIIYGKVLSKKNITADSDSDLDQS
ncbi:MAG: hypothetical protein RIG77_16350 [Cyclobacteriaceae bacterium]